MVPLLVSSFLWLDQESVEVDNEQDKPGKPNWGLARQLTARCHHYQELARGGECPGQPVPKVTTKIWSRKLVESVKCVMRSKRIDSVKYMVSKERDRRK